jgi:hypothetical protein
MVDSFDFQDATMGEMGDHVYHELHEQYSG